MFIRQEIIACLSSKIFDLSNGINAPHLLVEYEGDLRYIQSEVTEMRNIRTDLRTNERSRQCIMGWTAH